jgi:hypothetical protein
MAGVMPQTLAGSLYRKSLVVVTTSSKFQERNGERDRAAVEAATVTHGVQDRVARLTKMAGRKPSN